jgi:hypothetical protein
MLRRAYLLAALAGCTTDMNLVRACVEEATPVASDQAGSGGFTPSDVVAAVDGATLHVVLDDTRSGRLALPYDTDWTVEVQQSGDAAEVVRDFPEDGSNPNCAVGTFLGVPVDITLASADGVWEFAGPTTLEASGLTLSQVIVSEAAEWPVMISGPEEVILDEEDGSASCGGADGITTVSFYGSPLSGGRMVIEIAYGECDAEMYHGDFTGE